MTTNETTERPRSRMSQAQRRALGEWLGCVTLAEQSARALAEAAEAALGWRPTRANLHTAAADIGVRLPQGRPGRPRTRPQVAERTREDEAALAVEVRRIYRILDVTPVDPAALDRIASRA